MPLQVFWGPSSLTFDSWFDSLCHYAMQFHGFIVASDFDKCLTVSFVYPVESLLKSMRNLISTMQALIKSVRKPAGTCTSMLWRHSRCAGLRAVWKLLPFSSFSTGCCQQRAGPCDPYMLSPQLLPHHVTHVILLSQPGCLCLVSVPKLPRCFWSR